MKRFEPSMRVMLEENATGLNASVLKRIQQIERRAAEVRETGSYPREVLEDEVSRLQADIAYTTQQKVLDYDDMLTEAQQKYRQQVEKNPNLQLLKLQEAQLNINSMSDDELKDWATKVANDKVTPTSEEARVALTRLKGADRQLITDRLTTDYIDRPWLQDPEVKQIYKEKQHLENTPPGNVLIDGIAIGVEHLIDFDAELEQEA